MTLLIPFWAWIVLGVIIGWKIRGYFGKKFSFLGFIKNPFKEKKKRKPKIPRILSDDDDDDEPDDDKTVVEKAKTAANKVAGFFAGPIERFMGDDKDEEDEE